MSQVPPPLPIPTLPYAAPLAAVVAGGGIWRDGPILVLPINAILPPACVRCGEPETKRFKRTVYWHPSWVYLLILPGLLIFAIVALAIRKKATYECGLCQRHAAQRNKHVAITTLIVLTAVASFIAAIALAVDVFGKHMGDVAGIAAIFGILAMLAAAFYAAAKVSLLRVKRIDEHYAYYKGAGDGFLAPLSSVT